MSASAKAIREALEKLGPGEPGVETLQDSLTPVLKFLEGTPARAIILSAVVSSCFSYCCSSSSQAQSIRPVLFIWTAQLTKKGTMVHTPYHLSHLRTTLGSQRHPRSQTQHAHKTYTLIPLDTRLMDCRYRLCCPSLRPVRHLHRHRGP